MLLNNWWQMAIFEAVEFYGLMRYFYKNKRGSQQLPRLFHQNKNFQVTGVPFWRLNSPARERGFIVCIIRLNIYSTSDVWLISMDRVVNRFSSRSSVVIRMTIFPSRGWNEICPLVAAFSCPHGLISFFIASSIAL